MNLNLFQNKSQKKKTIWRRIWAGVEESNLCLAFIPNMVFLFPVKLLDLLILCFSYVQQNTSPNSLNYYKHLEISRKNDIVCIHLKDHDYISQLLDSNIITSIYLHSFRNKSHRGAINQTCRSCYFDSAFKKITVLLKPATIPNFIHIIMTNRCNCEHFTHIKYNLIHSDCKAFRFVSK